MNYNRKSTVYTLHRTIVANIQKHILAIPNNENDFCFILKCQFYTEIFDKLQQQQQ